MLYALALPDVTDYLAIDDCKPSIFLLFHVPECRCNLVEVAFSAVVAVQYSLLVIALDRSVGP